jgi:hypothetical protein
MRHVEEEDDDTCGREGQGSMDGDKLRRRRINGIW